MPAASQVAGEPPSVATSALDPEPLNPAELLGPCLELGVAASVSANRSVSQTGAVLVERHRDMDVLVSVDPNNHLAHRSVGHDTGHGFPPCGGTPAGRVDGQDCDESVFEYPGPYWVTARPDG